MKRLDELFDTSLEPVKVPSHPDFYFQPRAAVEGIGDPVIRALPPGHMALLVPSQAKREL